MPGSTFQPDLDRKVLEALESKPAPMIPADFAARMALRARALSPAAASSAMLPTHQQHTPHYGRNAAWASLIVLAALTLYLSPALASQTHGFSPLLLIQSILLLQLLALGLWLGSRLFPGNA
ncbi:hypothetical protein [Granulicella sibirica]|uniref:Uncharacterized protein n=1 Tax=Granulicella sibirica TaxID=2479048 RepID=A0A4Q0SY90_9BACT|nr:hypothetical protein [Granulicella sibirica]RXH56145.1 hypothetical protein GRAN_3002 [Granulicella sibirica]